MKATLAALLVALVAITGEAASPPRVDIHHTYTNATTI